MFLFIVIWFYIILNDCRLFPLLCLSRCFHKIEVSTFASHPAAPTVDNNRVYRPPSPPPPNQFFFFFPPLCTVTGRLLEDICTVSIKSNHVWGGGSVPVTVAGIQNSPNGAVGVSELRLQICVRYAHLLIFSLYNALRFFTYLTVNKFPHTVPLSFSHFQRPLRIPSGF